MRFYYAECIFWFFKHEHDSLWVFKTCKKRTRRTPQTGMRLVRFLVRLIEKSWIESRLSWA